MDFPSIAPLSPVKRGVSIRSQKISIIIRFGNGTGVCRKVWIASGIKLAVVYYSIVHALLIKGILIWRFPRDFFKGDEKHLAPPLELMVMR